MLTVSIVVAVADNGVIGRDNDLPWRLPADLAHFKRVTMGKPMLMGRRTFESIGRVLPGRASLVLTRDTAWQFPGTEVFAGIDEALAACTARGAEECAIIGGAQIYAAALPLATRLYLTQVHANVDGDTYFPALVRAEWREVERTSLAISDKSPLPISFVTLERRQPE